MSSGPRPPKSAPATPSEPKGGPGDEAGRGSTTTLVRERFRPRVQGKAWAQRYGALAALVALFIYNALDTPFFLTRQSLLFILLRQAAPIAIVAVGMAIVIGTAGIDLSVGSVMAIAGQVGATLVLHNHPFLVAIIAGILLIRRQLGLAILIVFAAALPIALTRELAIRTVSVR